MALYRCGCNIVHLTVGDFAVTRVPLFLFAFLVSSRDMYGQAEGRWLGTSTCDNEIIIALRTNAFLAYEGKPSALIPPGPRSRVGTIQIRLVKFCLLPNVTYLLCGDRKALCCCCWCGTPAESNGPFYSSGRSTSTGCGRSSFCKLEKPERWRPSRWPAEF